MSEILCRGGNQPLCNCAKREGIFSPWRGRLEAEWDDVDSFVPGKIGPRELCSVVGEDANARHNLIVCLETGAQAFQAIRSK